LFRSKSGAKKLLADELNVNLLKLCKRAQIAVEDYATAKKKPLQMQRLRMIFSVLHY
jgi:hypothetical protein